MNIEDFEYCKTEELQQKIRDLLVTEVAPEKANTVFQVSILISDDPKEVIDPHKAHAKHKAFIGLIDEELKVAGKIFSSVHWQRLLFLLDVLVKPESIEVERQMLEELRTPGTMMHYVVELHLVKSNRPGIEGALYTVRLLDYVVNDKNRIINRGYHEITLFDEARHAGDVDEYKNRMN